MLNKQLLLAFVELKFSGASLEVLQRIGIFKYVFCFGKHELCLLVEEFSVILSLVLYYPSILLIIFSSFSSIYSHFLGLDDKDVATILFREEIDRVALLSYLQRNGRAIDDILGIGLPSGFASEPSYSWVVLQIGSYIFCWV